MAEVTVDEVYNSMVEDFKANKNKRNLIQIMFTYCSKETTTPQQIYDLKKLLELNFSKDVKCVYCYTITPVDYGCDLREIFYDRNNNLIEGGQELLDIFNQKKLPDIWHIMTDIDDTLYPNNEHRTYIAGSDISWHQKTPYPGIRMFYIKFYNCLPKNAQYTTILSATPGCFKNSKLDDKNKLLHGILKNYGFIQGPESKLQVLSYLGNIVTNCSSQNCGLNNTTGNVDNISSLFKLFGNTKFERFKQYISIFPEYKILFIGDNGQGDVLAGKQMVQFNNRCHVFIHKVSENGRDFKTVDEESQGIPRLNFFKNYYELSLKFTELGIFNSNESTKIKESIGQHLKFRENSKFFGLYDTIRGGKTKKHRKYNNTKKYKNKTNKYKIKNNRKTIRKNI
jgi:hypothetical protein